MPGRHTQKQKRQAEHVADSESRRGKDPKEAERIGWATTNAQKSFQVHGPFASGKPGEHVYPTEKWALGAARKLDAHIPKPGSAGHEFHVKMYGVGAHKVKRAAVVPEQHQAVAGKSSGYDLMSIDACYDLIKDQAGRDAYHADAAKRRASDPARTAHVDKPPPATSDVSSRNQNERRVSKFPRKMKPTVRMKPISDEEAMTHLRSGAYNSSKQKSLRWLVALKALATGYSKTSGGGALKAANRGSMSLLGPSGRSAGKPGGHYRKRGLSGRANFGPDGRPGPRGDRAKFKQLRRAMAAMSSPVGAVKPPKVYLPGVHNPRSPVRRPAGLKSPTSAPRVPSVVKSDAGLFVSSRPAKADPVVIKSEGTEMPTQTKNVDFFDDLFKSELVADHLVDCPHCDAPITKSDLAKAGKGKTTDVSGPKRGKSSAHVRDHNPEGGAMRGGDGRGVHTSSRGVPGAKKHDEPAGVQNSKGSNARKGGADSSIEEDQDDVDKSVDAAPDPAAARPRAPAGASVKKSITIRGTEWVRYVDDGSDAALAKSIAEGALGGTSPTRPLDLNHDLTRLLI